jgi:glycosyltransferase involved in cell wall biosynthesis
LLPLGESIFTQDFAAPGLFDWVILDNGSTRADTLQVLAGFALNPIVHLVRSEENLGIIAGTRLLARRARGRYIVPVDHDDYLYPDAMRIVTCYLQRYCYPAFLYSDEDKIEGGSFGEPYLKPDWDPVLFVHSCYTSHLGVIDRGLALMLGLYTDAATEGSPDWDAFLRFMLAGYRPVHVPEVLYSWRKHPQSTAANINSKSFIHSSHRATLNRFRLTQTYPDRYSIEYSPLFKDTPDWCFRRAHVDPRPLVTVRLLEPGEEVVMTRALPDERVPEHCACLPHDACVGELVEWLASSSEVRPLVHLSGGDVAKHDPQWYWEVLALLEIFPDAVAVGGPLYNPDGICLSAGIHFGFGNGCGMPDRLRPRHDPGYFARLWKPHSVSALSSQNLVVESDFLLDAVLAAGISKDTPLSFLGVYIGSAAMRWGRRIVCSPLLAGSTRYDWGALADQTHLDKFLGINGDLLPDTRYYSSHLDLRAGHSYEFTDQVEQGDHLASLGICENHQVPNESLLSFK